jgi:hypothetical protein
MTVHEHGDERTPRFADPLARTGLAILSTGHAAPSAACDALGAKRYVLQCTCEPRAPSPAMQVPSPQRFTQRHGA